MGLMFDKKTVNVYYYDKKGNKISTFTHKIHGAINCYGHMRFDQWTIGDYRRKAPKGWNKYFYCEEIITDNGNRERPCSLYEYRYERDFVKSLSKEQKETA